MGRGIQKWIPLPFFVYPIIFFKLHDPAFMSVDFKLDNMIEFLLIKYKSNINVEEPKG